MKTFEEKYGFVPDTNSEMQGFEYTIPDGYEAEIKDGKVIVKKQSSDDERIRKEIIDFLTDGIWHTTIIDKVKQSQRYAKWISYLAKQKEREYKLYEKTKDRFYKEGVDDGILIGKKWQKEQKPAEWSEEEVPGETKRECGSIDVPRSIKTSRIETLKNLLSYFKLERKSTREEINISFIPCLEYLLKDVENSNDRAEWSEEDEKLLDFWLDVVDRNDWRMDENFCKASREFINRLKSLCSHPKQDYSSLSDKEFICLKRTLDYLRKEHNRYGGEDFTNEIAVLEWLITHPILDKPHWKPSEEQMRCLDDCVNRAREIHNASTSGYGAYPTLNSLLYDLKKL